MFRNERVKILRQETLDIKDFATLNSWCFQKLNNLVRALEEMEHLPITPENDSKFMNNLAEKIEIETIYEIRALELKDQGYSKQELSMEFDIKGTEQIEDIVNSILDGVSKGETQENIQIKIDKKTMEKSKVKN